MAGEVAIASRGGVKEGKNIQLPSRMGRRILFLAGWKCATKHKHRLKEEIWRGTTENFHPIFKDRYPPKSPICARNVDKLKSGLKAQQSLLAKPAAQNPTAAEASFHLSHLLAKQKKSQMLIYSRKQRPLPQRLFSASTTSSRASVRGRGSTSIKGLVTLNICRYSSMNHWMEWAQLSLLYSSQWFF